MRKRNGILAPLVLGALLVLGCSESDPTCKDLPEMACDPTPADGAADLSPEQTLNWNCGESPCEFEVTFEVYIGLGRSLELVGSTTEQSLTLSPLDWGKTYNWRVDARDENGTTEGPVWSFGTNRFWFQDLDSWAPLADFEVGSYMGGAMEWAGDLLYTLRGHSSPPDEFERSFWSYDPEADSWERLADAIFDPAWGASLAWTGADYIYALMGNGTVAFYHYSISEDAWIQLASLPDEGARRGGKLLAWPGGGDYLYAMKGIEAQQGEDSPFLRYSISLDEWSALAPVPGEVHDGCSLCWDGAGGFLATTIDEEFWHYDIAEDAWTAAAAFPGDQIAAGAYLCYDGIGFIWASGGLSDAIWIYDLVAGQWDQAPDAPEAFGWGGALASDSQTVYARPGGGSTTFWKLAP